MEFDSNQYIDLFFQDAEEHLEIMNEALLNLEQDHTNREPLQELFRAAHTMKSSSAMVGFMHISEFTHTMEDVLAQLRDGKVPVTEEVTDTLFACFDLIKEMIASLGDQTTESKKNQIKAAREAAVAKLHALLGMEVSAELAGEQKPRAPRIRLSEADRNRIEESRLAGQRIYEVEVVFEDDTPMAATRAFLICNNLRALGEIIVCDPDVENDDEAEVDSGFSLVFATQVPMEEVKAKASVGQVQDVMVRDMTEADQFEWPDEQDQAADAAQPGETASEVASESAVPSANAEKDVRTSFDRREDRTRSRTVRVDIGKLDRLLDLAGELVINRGRALELGQSLVLKHGNAGDESSLLDSIVQQGMIINQLQEAIMESRMVPIGQVFARFRRVVRDLSHSRGKEVDLVVEGEETELDKKIVDVIGDPLTHMIRNSVDHGFETPEERLATGKPRKGKLRLAASHEGNSILIQIQDDGRGLDLEGIKRKAIDRGLYTEESADQLSPRELIQLIFQPGFSTAKEVTDISGRGVGMDVVRRTIDELGGTVEIDTVAGKGSTFTIRLPLTLAIIQALLVETGTEMFALPIANVTETLRVTSEDLFTVEGKGEVIRLRDSVVPVLRLDNVLETPAKVRSENGRIYIAIVRHGSQQVGLIVDRMVSEQEVVIKSLSGQGQKAEYIAGASIMGNGKVILILDVASLVQETLGV